MGYTLVTGATSDIGLQICATLEMAGHSLLMTDLNEAALLDAKLVMQKPDRHKTLPLDLSNVEQAEALLAEYIANENIHVTNVVYGAGLFSIKPIKLVNYNYVKKNFDIALFSIIAITRVLASKKINGNNLRGMVMISSVSAIMGTKGYTVYGAVKASMLGLMKSMAVEFAPKIRVNAILPGGIRTRTTNYIYEMQDNPNDRYLLGNGEKNDIANMVEFLLSDKSRWITGQEFIVDGGLTAN